MAAVLQKQTHFFVVFFGSRLTFMYIVLYSFFPAFVLAFAYPTRVITIFTFVATFMVLSVVCLTTYIQNGAPHISEDKWKNAACKIFIWCTLPLIQVYFFLFIFALLYLLVIGRASVVSSAPLAVLSLLPSILISIAAWIIKSTLLVSNEHDNDTKGNDDTKDDEKKDGEDDEQVASSTTNGGGHPGSSGGGNDSELTNTARDN